MERTWRGDAARGGDAVRRRDAAWRGDGASAVTTPGASPEGRPTPQRNDRRREKDTKNREPIDPKLLVGVPRPRAALPDDTGRAYLTHPHDTGTRADARTHDVANYDRQREGCPPDFLDRVKALVDRPAFQDQFDDLRSPDRYGDPLTQPDGSRIPRFNERPTREQTRQGVLNDCGVIATLGAVASHRPGDIAHRIGIDSDGTYRVRLSEAQWAENGDGAEPTGRVIELSVTPDLPIYNERPNEPVFAKTEGGAAWSAVLEKAAAGVDGVWTASRRAEWADSWMALCKDDVAKELENPRVGPPPDGYVRLNQGSHPWDRAELLTQLTGRESAVRQVPQRAEDVTRVLAKQLNEHKPVLIAARLENYEGEKLPHGLQPSHVYEVVAANDGKISLRNPWNKDHPEPMGAEDFAGNMKSLYTTLK